MPAAAEKIQHKAAHPPGSGRLPGCALRDGVSFAVMIRPEKEFDLPHMR